MSSQENIQAHSHSSNHRKEIIGSKICGCFYCLEIFTPDQIKEWIDWVDNTGQTALCPNCGVDSVIGSNSGFPITREFLRKMKQQWF